MAAKDPRVGVGGEGPHPSHKDIQTSVPNTTPGDMFANEFLKKLKTITKPNKLKQEMNNLLSTF